MRGETVTRERVAAENVKRRPEWAAMIADAEGHAVAEESDSPPSEAGA